MLALASWATRAKILCFTTVFLSVVEFEFYVYGSLAGQQRETRTCHLAAYEPVAVQTSAIEARTSRFHAMVQAHRRLPSGVALTRLLLPGRPSRFALRKLVGALRRQHSPTGTPGL